MPPHGAKVLLVVDDDLSIRDVLAEAFNRYKVVHAADGQSALYQMRHELPDLVLMDLRLPDFDGLLLITKIRETSQTPIIVLSARHEQADIVQCLRNGADDFVDKPFDLDDLEARIEAVLRRSAKGPVPITEWNVGTLVLSHNDAHLDGKILTLTPAQHKLVFALVQGYPDPVSRNNLALALFGYCDDGTAHLIDVLVYRLRRKLERLPAAPRVVSIHGKGLALAAP